MPEKKAEAFEPTWKPEEANRVAAEVIAGCRTHDQFFQAMQDRGINSGLNNFNNFPARLSGPQGLALVNILSQAKVWKLYSADPFTLTTEETHDAVHTLLTKERSTFLEKGFREEDLQLAENELQARKTSATLIGAEWPAYCKIGDPMLLTKYGEKDLAAREFIFQCARVLILQGKRFYEDIWR